MIQCSNIHDFTTSFIFLDDVLKTQTINIKQFWKNLCWLEKNIPFPATLFEEKKHENPDVKKACKTEEQIGILMLIWKPSDLKSKIVAPGTFLLYSFLTIKYSWGNSK